MRAFDAPGNCPLSGKPLVKAEHDLSQLRSIQDWYLRYELTAVDGVSEVASVGGHIKQYQVEVDPNRLIDPVEGAIRRQFRTDDLSQRRRFKAP